MNGLSAKLRKELDKSEARKRLEFKGAWPKVREVRGHWKPPYESMYDVKISFG